MILIGGGGHARSLMDALRAQSIEVSAYVDPKPAPWLEQFGLNRLTEEELHSRLPEHPLLVMSYLGLTCEALVQRYRTMIQYKERGGIFPTIVHPKAVVSSGAHLAEGVQILAGAIININTRIDECAVVNTGAVIEHDTVIGVAAHIAPRAVVLGGAQVGDFSYIGSNAIILQNTSVAPRTFVHALELYKNSIAGVG